MTRIVGGWLVVGMIVACGPRVPPVPGQGGPPWVEVTSPHFTVWSDAAPEEVRVLIARMERMRAVLQFAAFPSVTTEGRGLAIVLRDDRELKAFSTTSEARPFAASIEAPLWQSMIVLSASNRSDDLERSLAHELTHTISFGVVHHQPRWFAEGMATYFQTAGLDPRRPIVEIGGSPTGGPLDTGHILPVRELFRWGNATVDERWEYTTAWALFWFLVNQHNDELQQLARLLDQAGAEVVRDSALVQRLWDQAFPTVPFAKLDGALHDWLFAGGTYTVKRLKVEPRPFALSQRPLADADVHALRAVLLQAVNKDPHAELAAALAREPTQVVARMLAVALDRRAPSVDEARALVAAHPDDWRAWLLLYVAHGEVDPDRTRDARARACQLARGNPALAPPPDLCGPTRPR